jgi:NADH dehydrogenase
MTVKTQIVILGGGFAGVETARYLDRTAAKRADVEVTLVSRDNFILFTPMLDEVVAGDLEPAHICNPLRKLLRHVTVLSAEIKAIDLAARQVTISYGFTELTRELPFDHLVLALGSETDYFGIPGVAEHALGIKTLGDAVMLRAGVIAMLEAASVEPDPDGGSGCSPSSSRVAVSPVSRRSELSMISPGRASRTMAGLIRAKFAWS